MLIELGDPPLKRRRPVGDIQKFYSSGLTRPRHHTVWLSIFGSTTLGPFEWNLFREGLKILVQEIEHALAKNRVSPKTGIAEFDSLSSRSKLSSLAVVAHSLHGQYLPPEKRTAMMQSRRTPRSCAVILHLIRREIAASREGRSPEGRRCTTRTLALAALAELCPGWDKPLPDVEAVGGRVTPYPTVEAEKIEDWENLIGELKNHVSWWRPNSRPPADPDADEDEDDEIGDERDLCDRRQGKVSGRLDLAIMPIAAEPADEQFEESREILSQLCHAFAGVDGVPEARLTFDGSVTERPGRSP